MDNNTKEQLTQPLNYDYYDPEAQSKVGPNEEAPMVFNDPKPQFGYEFVPPEGSVPKEVIMNKLYEGILKRLQENGCKYEGETNSDGLMHGKGRNVYFDGSVYDGQWCNGLREGHGIFTQTNGTIYDGQWKNDQKHGPGKLKLPDGITIETIWENDKKHGQGFIISKDGSRGEVTYYRNLEIRLGDQNDDCHNCFICNLILVFITILFFGLTPFFYDNQYDYGQNTYIAFIVFGVFFYIFQLVEGLCGKTAQYLRNVTRAEEANHIINGCRAHPPIVKFEIQNYHYETRHHHSNGRTRTERVRVNTHHHIENFRFLEWLDQSPDASVVDFIKVQKLTRMQFKLDFDYTPCASQSFNCQEYDFKHHHIRDSHYDFHVHNNIEGYREFVLMHNNLEEGLPWYANFNVYAFLTVICLGWIQRIIFVNNSKKVGYTFRKLILK